ncbi:MAG: hypothetical protein ACOVMG_06160 [Flavobacterium sp.]
MKNILTKILLISILLISLSEATNYLLDYKNLIYNSLVEQLTTEQLKSIFDFQKKWQWVSYALIPILLLIKTSIISSILYIGAFFSSKETTFKTLFSIVLSAEFIFLIIPVFKIIWFYFFQTNYTLEDIQYFFPLSALNITGYQGVDPWLIYPLQVLNLFEVACIIFLSYQIGHLTKTNADTGLKIVAYSYVPALLLWVAVVMFFTLNYS